MRGVPVSTNPYQNQPVANPAQQLPQEMAIVSLVAGILSLTMCGIFAAIPAIICGHIGMKKADRGEASGRGMAMAGMIMGYVSLVLTVLFIAIYAFFVVVAVGAAAGSP
tara:strand:- start:223 stop:549 length:327 start_codon:yes stop_codon:yes gene_type:complete